MGDVRQQGGAGAMNVPAGTPVIVDVLAEANGGKAVFSHRWRFQDGPDQGSGTIDVPRRKANEPGTPINFHFEPGNTGLMFLQDEANVIWCDRHSCPVDEKKSDAEIEVRSVAPRQLVVFDRNDDACTLHYNLRFSPDPDRNYYDPEIKNGGKV